MAQDRPLEEIGLGPQAQSVLFALALLPLVGLVIGTSYAVRRNAATRQFGRKLLGYSLVLNAFFACCITPALLLWAASR
jgi:hypothetical protein